MDVGPGQYYVTVTDNNGCEANGDWEINRFDPLVLNVNTENVVDCEAQDISQIFTAIAVGGVPPYQFNWSSGTVSGANNETMSTNQNGLVILEVTDSYGCSISYSHNVETPSIGEPDFFDKFSCLQYLWYLFHF